MRRRRWIGDSVLSISHHLMAAKLAGSGVAPQCLSMQDGCDCGVAEKEFSYACKNRMKTVMCSFYAGIRPIVSGVAGDRRMALILSDRRQARRPQLEGPPEEKACLVTIGRINSRAEGMGGRYAVLQISRLSLVRRPASRLDPPLGGSRMSRKAQ